MIYVVGAFCLDIIVEGDEFLDNTSTPGRISVRPGGVGYNIYGHIQGAKRLITAVGNDTFSDFVRSFVSSDWGDPGDSGKIILHSLDAPPPLYVAFMEKGELKTAASQMDAVEQALDATTIMSELQNVNSGDIVILDANLHPVVMADVVDQLRGRCRIIFEPISSAKAARHVEHLSDIFLLTPDRREFEVLLESTDPPDEAVLKYLADRRIDFLLATRGKEGARLYDSGSRVDFAPNTCLEISDSTGAGDMLTALLAEEIALGTEPYDAVPGCMAKVEAMLATRSRL
jgi:sugar/nucleoside kinase (ribokinase family)